MRATPTQMSKFMSQAPPGAGGASWGRGGSGGGQGGYRGGGRAKSVDGGRLGYGSNGGHGFSPGMDGGGTFGPDGRPDTRRISQFGTSYGMLPVFGWTVQALVGALSGLIAGDFSLSGRLAADMRVHPWIAHALRVRNEFTTTCPLNFTPAGRNKGEQKRAQRCCDFIREAWPDIMPLATLRDLHFDELLNGQGVWAQDWEERRDGRDRWWLPFIKPWAPELLGYKQLLDETSIDGGAYTATTLSHGLLRVQPGGGRWGMFSGGARKPFLDGAVHALGEAFTGDGFNFRDNMAHQEKWGRGITKVSFPVGWRQEEVNTYAASLVEGGGGGVLLCPTDAQGNKLVDAELLRADGAGWQTFDATEKRILRRILIYLLRQDMTSTGTTGIADNDPRALSLWKCREVDASTYGDASCSTAWEEVGGVRRPVPVWSPRDGEIRRSINSWIAAFNFGDANLAPYVWWDATPPDDYERRMDGAAKRGQMRAQALQSIGMAAKNLSDGGLSLKPADIEHLGAQCGIEFHVPDQVAQPPIAVGGPSLQRDENETQLRADQIALVHDALAGVQVRISGVGEPFHGGHGAGVGPSGGHGMLTSAEQAHKATTDAAEKKHKEEFLAHGAAAKHHAEQAKGHAAASDAHASGVAGSTGEGQQAAIAHHAGQAAAHAVEAQEHAAQTPAGHEAHAYAQEAKEHYQAASKTEADHKAASEPERRFRTEAEKSHADELSSMRALHDEYAKKLPEKQQEHADLAKKAASLEQKVATSKGNAKSRAKSQLADVKKQIGHTQFAIDYSAKMANEYSKAIEKHEAGKREMVERHVQDSLRGAAIIRGAQASGHDVHHGEHGVDFHVHPDVHPAAYGQAARQIESMTAHSPQVQAAIRAQNVRVFIYPEGTRLTDHTPFATLNDRVSTNGVHYEEAGGVANVPHAGARYLATSEGRRFGGADRNQVTDHEVTHAIHFAAEHVQSGKVSDRVGEAKNGRYKESLDYRARQAYDARKASGLEFPSHYGGDNHYEYFAEAGSAWHSKSLDGRDRAWMKANDPHMSKILTDVFGDH